jgi:BirA family biotin operon repressor/biotin-[acetyl-CoA-carboxylase] ligase
LNEPRSSLPPWDSSSVSGKIAGCQLGNPLVFLDEIGSTVDEVWSRAAGGAQQGLAVVAESQTRGRGRAGNVWHSPAGVGVWISFLLRPRLAPERMALLTLGGGVAAARAAESLGVSVGLKWPNDLIAADGTGRKIGGVLAESRSESGEWTVVLSMGINVNSLAEDFPEEIRARAASLRVVAGHPVSREEYLIALIQSLSTIYGTLDAGDTQSLLADWRSLSPVFGRAVRVRGGAAEVEGVASDVGEDGALIVRLESGAELEVRAGELEVLWEGGGAHS